MTLELFISIIWCDTTCRDDIDEEQILLPAYYEQTRWGQIYVEDKIEKKTKGVITNCQDVIFPLHDLTRNNCDDCTTQLKVLSLADTTSSVLPKGAIPETPSYNNLILNDLNISKILPGAFGRQGFLKISISKNKLEEIELGTFNSLTKLQNIDMSSNNLKSLPPHCLLGVPDLKTLIVSNNALNEFSFDILDASINEMESIDLSENKISKLSRNIQIHINNFYLSNNQIKIIEFCPFKFITLNLSHNFLESLNESSCDGDTNENRIKTFDVSFNKLSKLKQFYFENASNLEYLYLNHNNIREISTGVFFNLYNLKTLNLSGNYLQEFQYGTFDSLQNLIILDLSSNNIKTINAALHALTNMKELYLQNNNIESIDAKQLMYNSNILEQISFYNNNFSCDNLVRIIYDFKNQINVTYGNNRNISNIHGISCSDTKTVESSRYKNVENSYLENISSVLEDIKNKISEDKFMPNQKPKYIKLNDTEILKYFNIDFEQSKFYKYLESLKNPTPMTIQNNATPQKLVDFQKFENTDIITKSINIILIMFICILSILISVLNFLVYKILKKKFKSVRDEVELLQA